LEEKEEEEEEEEAIQNTRADVRVPFVIPFRRDLLKLTKVQFYFQCKGGGVKRLKAFCAVVVKFSFRKT
jgi:hypothetical protein